MSAAVVGRISAFPVLAALALAAMTIPPSPAVAGFELVDASPAALGGASMDLPGSPLFDREPGAWNAAASHAALFQVEGLTAEQLSAGVALIGLELDVGAAQVGAPGLREHAIRIGLREPGPRGVALRLEGERLDLVIEGEPKVGGWTVGGAVATTVPLAHVALDVEVGGHRLFRSDSLRRLGLLASVPVTIGLRTRGGSIAWIDRWEGSGRSSPRLVLDVPLGARLNIRLAGGQNPGRIGAACAVRVGPLEVSVGRLDGAAGVVTSAAIRLVGRPNRIRGTGAGNP